MKIALMLREDSDFDDLFQCLAIEQNLVRFTKISIRMTNFEKFKLISHLYRKLGLLGLAYYFIEKSRENRYFRLNARNISKAFFCDEVNFLQNSAELCRFLQQQNFDCVILGPSGIVKSDVINASGNRIINIHPAKLPEYRGYAEPAHALLAHRLEDVGFTVHLVTPGLDKGPIVSWVPFTVSKVTSLSDLLSQVRVAGYRYLLKNLVLFGPQDLLSTAKIQNEMIARNVDFLPWSVRKKLDKEFKSTFKY